MPTRRDVVASGLASLGLLARPSHAETATMTENSQPAADLVLVNARVTTLDRGNPQAAAVAVKDGRTLGVGAGQMNRIGSAEIALKQAHAAGVTEGLVLASDGFFPFDDCVTLAAEYGVTAIVQPGGSVRDEDSIRKADEKGIAMVFTGERHFKH